jgi:hypothetical protein
MAFFLGDPQTGTGGHEDMAEKISRQASTFSRKYWRSEDMKAYVSLSLRLVEDGRLKKIGA